MKRWHWVYGLGVGLVVLYGIGVDLGWPWWVTAPLVGVACLTLSISGQMQAEDRHHQREGRR